MRGHIIDLFAGGGGASAGLEAALGRPVDLAVNHDATAIAVHTANHPNTVHLTEDIWKVDPLEATGGAPVDVLWASPDCTHFSDRSGGFVGAQALDGPAPTVTTKDHNAPVAATLLRFNHDDHGVELGAPMPAATAQGNHVAEVRAFLTAFYGTDGTPGKGQRLDRPARTITARHRLGLVTIHGVDYQIVDIGMRMLEPHELGRAQFGRFADRFDLSRAKTKSAKVRLIGNSVCPEIVEALVAANASEYAAVAA